MFTAEFGTNWIYPCEMFGVALPAILLQVLQRIPETSGKLISGTSFGLTLLRGQKKLHDRFRGIAAIQKSGNFMQIRSGASQLHHFLRLRWRIFGAPGRWMYLLAPLHG